MDKVVLLVQACQQLNAYKDEKAFRELIQRSVRGLKLQAHVQTHPQIVPALAVLDFFSGVVLKKQASMVPLYTLTEVTADPVVTISYACLYIGAPVLKEFDGDLYRGTVAAVSNRSFNMQGGNYNALCPPPTDAPGATDILFSVHYDDGDNEELDFDELRLAIAAASVGGLYNPHVLNDVGLLRVWQVAYNSFVARPSRPKIPFKGKGSNKVPATANDLDFGLGTFAGNSKTSASMSFRFPYRVASAYGCTCQFITHWGLPCRHTLKILNHLNVPLDPTAVNPTCLAHADEHDAPSTTTHHPQADHQVSARSRRLDGEVGLNRLTAQMNKLAVKTPATMRKVTHDC